MQQKKVVIIGSGVAGLATAIRLASNGFDVSVYEKNETYGGKLGFLQNKDFKFDTGPSLFTVPHFIEDLFTYANEPIAEYFTYKKLPLACKYFFSDGTTVNAFTENELFANELSNKLNENTSSVLGYLNSCNNLYNKTGLFFLNHSLHKVKSYFSKNFFRAFTGFKISHLTKNLHQYNSTSFKNPKTVQIFNRFATYNGSNPYKASAMLSQISHLEHNDGVYYPKGGMKAIADALYNLALKKNVNFFFNSTVDRIIYTKNEVKGIVIGEKNIGADIVISNMDIFFTYKKLLFREVKAEKILKRERSSSALIFYWSINKNFKDLGLHNIFFSDDYKEEFNHIFNKKKIYSDPTIYINITSKEEPGVHSPVNKENWFVMINVPSSKNINWEAEAKKCKENVIKKISTILNEDILNCIETEDILNPQKIESQTASYLGSLYGSSSNSKMSAFLRQANFSKDCNGLYFVGGSVHPGGGIPLCLKSAEITAELILRKYG